MDQYINFFLIAQNQYYSNLIFFFFFSFFFCGPTSLILSWQHHTFFLNGIWYKIVFCNTNQYKMTTKQVKRSFSILLIWSCQLDRGITRILNLKLNRKSNLISKNVLDNSYVFAGGRIMIKLVSDIIRNSLSFFE